jgi:hypothetical protein
MKARFIVSAVLFVVGVTWVVSAIGTTRRDQAVGERGEPASQTFAGVIQTVDRDSLRQDVSDEQADWPSFHQDDLHAGAILPDTGMIYFELPPKYHIPPNYRYAYVNDQMVIVELQSRRVVDVIN